MAGVTVLVTGASGYIASHTIIQLLNAGYTVRGTVRSAAKGEAVRALIAPHAPAADTLTFVEIDLMSDDGWTEAAADCRYLLHLASPLPLVMPKNAEALIAPARDGALRALKAAKEADVERVVMTSSMAAIAYGKDHPVGRVMDENDWTDPDHADNTAYTRSKVIAEQAARDWMAREGGDMEFVTVNPTLVLGPVLGRSAGTSVELMRQILSGAMPAAPKMKATIVDVRDVADLHIKAMVSPNAVGAANAAGASDPNGAVGGRYLASGDEVSIAEIGRYVREAFPKRGKKAPVSELPSWAVKAMGVINPPVRQIAIELEVSRTVSHAKATRELDWTPRDWRDTVRDTVESLFKYKIV